MPRFDRIIKNGMVIDGTRAPRYRADIGITDGRIAEIGKLEANDAAHVIDAFGLIAADLTTLRRLCDEAGRDFSKIEISVFIPIEYDEPRKTLEEYAGAGAHRLIFTLWPPALTEDGIESIARKYLS
jgi:Urease alpha-subunit, N-terminal domain